MLFLSILISAVMAQPYPEGDDMNFYANGDTPIVTDDPEEQGLTLNDWFGLLNADGTANPASGETQPTYSKNGHQIWFDTTDMYDLFQTLETCACASETCSNTGCMAEVYNANAGNGGLIQNTRVKCSGTCSYQAPEPDIVEDNPETQNVNENEQSQLAHDQWAQMALMCSAPQSCVRITEQREFGQ